MRCDHCAKQRQQQCSGLSIWRELSLSVESCCFAHAFVGCLCWFSLSRNHQAEEGEENMKVNIDGNGKASDKEGEIWTIVSHSIRKIVAFVAAPNPILISLWTICPSANVYAQEASCTLLCVGVGRCARLLRVPRWKRTIWKIRSQHCLVFIETLFDRKVQNFRVGFGLRKIPFSIPPRVSLRFCFPFCPCCLHPNQFVGHLSLGAGTRSSRSCRKAKQKGKKKKRRDKKFSALAVSLSGDGWTVRRKLFKRSDGTERKIPLRMVVGAALIADLSH